MTTVDIAAPDTAAPDIASGTAIPTVTSAERAARLAEAGRAWSDRIDADRHSARLTYRVDGSARGAVGTGIRAGRHTFEIDEPPALAGDDAAASPVEYALAALIGCQIVMYRLYAQQLGIPVDDIRVRAEGDLDAARLLGKDPGVRPGFTAVRLHVELDGPESAERYAELRAAVDANCPVFDLFANPTPVEVIVTKA